MSLLRAQVPESGVPSPRAQEYIDNGEWDADSLISIQFLSGTACRGVVGGSSLYAPRFCGLPSINCGARSHEVSSWHEFKPGWYIPAGTSARSGFFQNPSLPPSGAGGPILSGTARALRDPKNSFKLSVGQWKFIIEEWHASRVGVLSDNSSPVVQEDEGASAFWSFNLDTQRPEIGAPGLDPSASAGQNISQNFATSDRA